MRVSGVILPIHKRGMGSIAELCILTEENNVIRNFKNLFLGNSVSEHIFSANSKIANCPEKDGGYNNSGFLLDFRLGICFNTCGKPVFLVLNLQIVYCNIIRLVKWMIFYMVMIRV